MQIRTESVMENQTALGRLQTDIASFIFNFKSEMLTTYNESDLMEGLRAAASDEDADLKAFYWRTWYLGRRRFTSDDRLLAMYLYDANDNLVSTYRYNCTTFPRNIYNADYDMNTESVTVYLESDRSDLLITGYYNSDEYCINFHMIDKKVYRTYTFLLTGNKRDIILILDSEVEAHRGDDRYAYGAGYGSQKAMELCL